MNNSIYPCLWFDNQASEAATFYCSIFENSSITANNPMVTKFELEGKAIMALNGGPMYKISPAISLFVFCHSIDEIERIYKILMQDGSAMMPLDTYPWSAKYGWVIDKYGMTWQLMLGENQEEGSKIIPSLLFVNDRCGKAEQAIHYYMSIFPHSEIQNCGKYNDGEALPKVCIKFCRYALNNQQFAAMDGPGKHNFGFNEGVSFVVECETQSEINHYWNNLSEEGAEAQCGWLKDKFGVSWQIVPSVLSTLMSDPGKADKVVAAFMKMKKFDIEQLMAAAN